MKTLLKNSFALSARGRSAQLKSFLKGPGPKQPGPKDPGPKDPGPKNPAGPQKPTVVPQGESWFDICPRDKDGHCLPQGQADQTKRGQVDNQGQQNPQLPGKPRFDDARYAGVADAIETYTITGQGTRWGLWQIHNRAGLPHGEFASNDDNKLYYYAAEMSKFVRDDSAEEAGAESQYFEVPGYDLGGGEYPESPNWLVVDIIQQDKVMDLPNGEKPEYVRLDLNKKKWGLPPRSYVQASKLIRELSTLETYDAKVFAQNLWDSTLPGGTIRMFDDPKLLAPVIRHLRTLGGRASKLEEINQAEDGDLGESEIFIKKPKKPKDLLRRKKGLLFSLEKGAVSGTSWFDECPRDKSGHCLPKGRANEAGQAQQQNPSGSEPNRPPPAKPGGGLLHSLRHLFTTTGGKKPEVASGDLELPEGGTKLTNKSSKQGVWLPNDKELIEEGQWEHFGDNEHAMSSAAKVTIEGHQYFFKIPSMRGSAQKEYLAAQLGEIAGIHVPVTKTGKVKYKELELPPPKSENEAQLREMLEEGNRVLEQRNDPGSMYPYKRGLVDTVVTSWADGKPLGDLDGNKRQAALQKYGDQAHKQVLYDYLLGNCDRHEYNLILGKDKLWAIDNEFVLPAEDEPAVHVLDEERGQEQPALWNVYGRSLGTNAAMFAFGERWKDRAKAEIPKAILQHYAKAGEDMYSTAQKHFGKTLLPEERRALNLMSGRLGVIKELAKQERAVTYGDLVKKTAEKEGGR